MSRIAQDLEAHHAAASNGLSTKVEMQRMATTSMPHIAVIGAGFAGLRCTDVLVRNGIRVTLFEARNRVGGRVCQNTSSGFRVDMGPNWIHGTVGNPIMKIAQKTGTIVMEPEERQIIFDSDGKQKDAKRSSQLGAEVWGIIVKAFTYSDDHFHEIDPKTSLMDYFQQEVKKLFPGDDSLQKDVLEEAHMWGFFVGEAIERQSLRNFWLEESLDGENVIVTSTYHSILQEVARTALEKAELRMEAEITKIVYEQRSTGEKVTLTTKEGKQQTFDEVVVTCPLGWLKRNNKNVFTPRLPHQLSQAIDNISYGRLEKLMITFPTAFWKQGSSTPLFVHFQHPNYHPDPASHESNCWNQSIVSMASFPSDSDQPTLLCYLYGPCSTHLTNLAASHAPHSPSYNKVLSDFAQPFLSRFPNYSADDENCKPTHFLVTQWQQDPHAGYGSYSNFQIGLDRGDEDIECMRNAGGLSDDGYGLWLAGEHTAPFVALGTTTGAYWSGEAVAKRILSRYGIHDLEEGSGEESEPRSKDLNGKMDGANMSGLAP